jgi:putative membrane protein insertion efficiency factor
VGDALTDDDTVDARDERAAGVATESHPSVPARPLIAMVRGYQAVRAGRPSPCRFWPSCSAYAVEALEVHGAVKGLGLAAWRIARCNPFGGHGVDPVPEKKARRV